MGMGISRCEGLGMGGWDSDGDYEDVSWIMDLLK